jgi:cobalt-zinc-cadmium efflux system membrane fusion protein
MNANQQYEESMHAQGEGHLIAGTPSSSPPSAGGPAQRKMALGQRAGVAILLTVVVVPPLAGFYSYFSGVPLRLLASTKEEKESSEPPTAPSVSLVSGQHHTLDVPDEVCDSLGIRKSDLDSVAVAKPPVMMRPLVLPGSTALDPTRLARIRARFAPARLVELAQVWDRDPKTGHTEFRELRQGDSVSKGDRLGIFYSLDVGSRKNDLLDALVQLELDQKIMDRVEQNRYAVSEVYYLTQVRAVQGDRNAINRALNNLKLWDIPQDEIDALHAEAKKISADKDAWYKTPEGRWVKGEKQANGGKPNDGKETNGKLIDGKHEENPWGRVTLRAPFDGVVIERNVHVDEMVVDNTVNLFQIADVNRLLVIASCPEDALPTLESLGHNQRRWTVRTVGAASATGLQGTIDEIGYLIDPNQHTAVIKGYVENPGKHIRAGQYVTATINIPPPGDVVEVPTDALVDDGLQSLVFVQADAALHQFTMRRVQVTQRFERSVFVRDTPIPKEEQLTAVEAEEGLLPTEPLRPGERVLLSGAVELKAAVLDLESRLQGKPNDLVAKAKPRSVSQPELRPEQKPKARKS